MAMEKSKYTSLIEKTHTPDRSVMPNKVNLSSYAMGWRVHQNSVQEINHSGLNPNFTSYITFSKAKKVGVAVLANSNSAHTVIVGMHIMKKLNGGKK